jgi:hypothetical protein
MFHRNEPGVDLMVIIFCDFRQMAFFSKTDVMIKFLQNLALFRVKMSIISAFFGENIFKIIASVPVG